MIQLLAATVLLQ